MRLLDCMVVDHIGMSRKEALEGPHHSVSQFSKRHQIHISDFERKFNLNTILLAYTSLQKVLKVAMAAEKNYIEMTKIKWGRHFNITDLQWKKYYNISFQCTKSSKLQWLQYQIINISANNII